jgi:hypothetical protein
MHEPYNLTPADIMDLRGSCPIRGSSDGTHDRLGVPFIVAIPSDGTFALHAYGSPQAIHADPRVLGACLLAERLEPGYIARILSTEDPATLAALSPAERQRQRAQRAEETARAAAYRREQDEAASRRMSLIDASRVSLDDI